MSQTPLLGSRAVPTIPITATSIGYDGTTSGLTATDLQAAIDAMAAGLLGAYLRTTLGGVGEVQALGSLGATETIDLANANYFAGTLNADCTIGFTGWTASKDCQITVELTEDGTGGWTPTFSGVTWIGGTPTWDTTAGTVTLVVLLSRDGGTTIYGAVVGGGSLSDTSLVTVAATGAAETVDVSVARTYDLTLDAATVTLTLTGADTAEAWFVTLVLRQDGSGGRLVTWPGSVVWPGGVTPTLSIAINAVDVFTLFTLDGGTVWFGFQAGGGGGTTTTTADIQLASPPHVHVAYETHTSDGATVTFTLDQTYEPGSVMAWNRSTNVLLGVTEVLPDQATISAAGAAGNLLDFHYAASIV